MGSRRSTRAKINTMTRASPRPRGQRCMVIRSREQGTQGWRHVAKSVFAPELPSSCRTGPGEGCSSMPSYLHLGQTVALPGGTMLGDLEMELGIYSGEITSKM